MLASSKVAELDKPLSGVDQISTPVSVPEQTVNQSSANKNKALVVKIGGFSSAGIKAENQDAFAVRNPGTAVGRYKGIVACMADGVSCSDNAQLASQTAVNNFIDDYYSTPESWLVKTAASRILSALNDWLYRQGQARGARHNGLITTFSAAVLKSQTAHLFHLGDSRIYRLRNGDLEQLTVDHTSNLRGNTVLTRALGVDSHLEVDYRAVSLEPDDLLILTTDGVHDVLTHQQLRSALGRGDLATQKELEVCAQKIVDQSLQQDSRDNLSCLLLKVVSIAVEDFDEIHRQLTARVIPPVLDVGQKIDGHEVIDVLHSSTRSHLYLVRTKCDGKLAVLKAPSENFSEDLQYLDGFARERWVAQRIDNPAVMKIFPQHSDDAFLYHLCEYIPGQSLRQWMHDNPQPSLEQVRKITRGIIQGLRAFQRLGMVHRDIKPENVLMTESGQIKLIDFGTVLVGGLTEINTPLEEDCPVGSVDYIAPEYLLGQPCSVLSDLFSLAVMVYEMLTGEQPFNMSHVSRRIPGSHLEWKYRSARQYRKDLPQWIDLCLQKATAPNVVNRYQALSEFFMDLSTPNSNLLAKQASAPLMERNPLKFWQLTSALLMIIVITQAFI